MADKIDVVESIDSIDSFVESDDSASLLNVDNSVADKSINNTNKKMLFSSRIDKHLDDHTLFELFILSIKHVFWVFLTSVPSITFVSLVGFGYSQLPWTNSLKTIHNNTNNTTIQTYYNPRIILIFDDVIRSVLLSLIPIFLLSVMVNSWLLNNKWKWLLKNIVYVSIPLVIFSIVFFAIFNHFFNWIWYYYIDILVFEIVFLMSLILASFIWSRTRSNASFRILMKHLLLPAVIAAVGIGFVDVYLSKTYQLQIEGSWQKYLIRLIVYPLLVDSFVSFGEYNIRKIKFCDTDSRSHVIYVFQVAFGIIGRYMTITSGSLKYIALVAFLIGMKDVLLHRMSRFQCWIAFHCRVVLRKCKCIEDSAEKFEDWFFEEEFKSFRAHVLNSEFVNELTTAFVVPVIVVSFEKHKLLFDFDYNSFFDEKGNIDNNYFLEQEIIQLVFLLLSFIIITMIEARFNGVDLRVVYKRVGLLQQFSQVVIFFWGMFLLLSSVRILPNYFQCGRNDICSCSFFIDKSLYGCTNV